MLLQEQLDEDVVLELLQEQLDEGVMLVLRMEENGDEDLKLEEEIGTNGQLELMENLEILD